MDPALLVGTDDGFRVVGSNDRGLPSGERMIAIAVDSDGLWAVGHPGTVWRHSFDGEGEPVVQLPDGVANCVLPTSDGVLIGADRARLFHWDGSALTRVDSFDEAPGRDDWHTPWGGPPDVRSLARGIEGTLYANVHVGGVVASDGIDGPWRDTMDIGNDVHEVVTHGTEPGTAFAAAAVGVGRTDDAGTTWKFSSAGLHARYSRAVAHSDVTLFASISDSSRGSRAAVYRRALNGDSPFERCVAGLPEWFSDNINTFCIATSGSTVAIGDPGGTVYVSEDDGETWATAASGYPGLHCLAFVEV